MVKLYKDYLENITDYGLLAYIAILYYNSGTIVDLNTITASNLIIGNSSLSIKIKEGLRQLNNINILNEQGKNFNIDVSELLNYDGYFVLIRKSEISKIMSSNFKIDKKIGLLKYFIAIVSTFNNSKKLKSSANRVSTMGMQYLSELVEINKRSAIRYNNDLEKLGLLYIHRSDDFRLNNGEIQQLNNCYSRPEDKEICIKVAESFEHSVGAKHIKLKKAEANRKRSETMKAKSDAGAIRNSVQTQFVDNKQQRINWLQQEIIESESSSLTGISGYISHLKEELAKLMN